MGYDHVRPQAHDRRGPHVGFLRRVDGPHEVPGVRRGGGEGGVSIVIPSHKMKIVNILYSGSLKSGRYIIKVVTKGGIEAAYSIVIGG